MFDAGLAPKELYQKAAHQRDTGQPEASAEPYRDQLLGIGSKFGVEIPLDKDDADIMLCVPRTDIEHYPSSAVAALARVMQHLGASCTFRSDGFGGRELRLLCGRQGLAARHQPAADRTGHRLQGQDPAGSGMRPCLHRPALGGGRPVRQTPALQGAFMSPNSWRTNSPPAGSNSTKRPPARPPSTIPANWCARAASPMRPGP